MSAASDSAVVVFDPHPDDADFWTGGMALLLRGMKRTVHYVCVDPRARPRARGAGFGGGARSASPFSRTAHPGQRGPPVRSAPDCSGALRELGSGMVFIPPMADYHRTTSCLRASCSACFTGAPGLDLGEMEVYAYDSHENRDPVEIYLDISPVWDAHIASLRLPSHVSRGSRSRQYADPREDRPRAAARGERAGRAGALRGRISAAARRRAEDQLAAGAVGDRFYYRAPAGLLNL